MLHGKIGGGFPEWPWCSGVILCVCSSSADYLDNGNNKMAIQQADKLLKKHKDLHCAKVSGTGGH